MTTFRDELPNDLSEPLVQESSESGEHLEESQVQQATPSSSESEERREAESNNGASFAGSVFNLATTIIGAGIMALPATMKILGLVPGIVMILLKAFLTNTTIEFLLRSSGIANATSYGALMQDSFGRLGKILLEVAVLVSNVGVLIVYMIIIGQVFGDMLQGWVGKTWWDQRTVVLLFTTLVFAPFTAFKNIDDLKYASAISLILAGVFLFITGGIVVAKFTTGGLETPKLYPRVTDVSSFLKLFTVVPVLVNAFICHTNVHSIQNELRDRTQIKPVVRSALITSSTVYILTSLFGYLLFGEATGEDVLNNFETDLHISYGPVLSMVVRLSYAAHLVLVFPIIFYPLRVNVDGLFFSTYPPLATSTLRFGSITAGLVAVIFVGANFIPNIWIAFQVTGATASLCIGFIFPAAVILRDRHNQATWMDKAKSILVIVIAVFSNGVAVYSTLAKKNKVIFPNPM